MLPEYDMSKKPNLDSWLYLDNCHYVWLIISKMPKISLLSEQDMESHDDLSNISIEMKLRRSTYKYLNLF